MKVLVLSNKVPYPANDGSSIAMSSIIDALLKNKAEVTLLSINTKKHFKSDEATAAQLPTRLDFHKVYHNTSITPWGALANLFSGKAYHVSRFYFSAFAKKLVLLLRQNSFDIIQIEGLSMAVYIELIRKYCQAKIVLRAHNVEHIIWDRHLENESSSLRSKYLKIQNSRLAKFEIQSLKSVDAIVPITEEDKQLLLPWISKSKPIQSLPCGIDIEAKDTCSKASTQTADIAYLASFDWMPNVQGIEWFMQKVWPLVQELRPDTTFHLGGRHMPSSFQKWEKRGVSLFQDVADMRKFICSARIVIVPLLAGSGMRIKVIENMALGKCQVSTTIGAEGVNIENGKDIILTDSPEDFARAISNLLHDDELRTFVETQARKTIETSYSNRQLGKNLIKFYQSLI
ncbi:glycosyltransferase family 4 protein [Owenweeksia hongkongensis]|uniref:glycosyltransferase family 4 protein n=1 Tax=Owenweeksia hongkongensis TaxID=253245 RepID=UPI0002F78A87|nr:glycosyltransferase family 4 protein [Owenweeksia hongkongensis]